MIKYLFLTFFLLGGLNLHATFPLSPGVYTAALTPMNEDLSCNNTALVNHCNDLINKGCQGVVLFGTTGEGCSFSVFERKKSLRHCIKLGLDPKKMIIGVITSSYDDAVKLSRFAVRQKCAAVLIAPPFFLKNVSDEGIINFYKKIIEEVNDKELKIVLYHIPQFSGVAITPHVIKSLSQEFPDTVIGIKDSEGNFDFTKEILTEFPNFQVFIGNELHLSEAVQLGASGGISGIANVYPELICSLYEYGKDKQKPNYNEKATNIIQSFRKYPVFAAIKKAVADQKGEDWHAMRPPLVPLNKDFNLVIEE